MGHSRGGSEDPGEVFGGDTAEGGEIMYGTGYVNIYIGINISGSRILYECLYRDDYIH